MELEAELSKARAKVVVKEMATVVGPVGHGLYFRVPRKYISSMLTITVVS